MAVESGSFFIRRKKTSEARGKKRKAEDGKDKVRKKFAPKLNEEISSDSETESAAHKKKVAETLEIEETAQEKKLRLAKLYLEQFQEEEQEKAEEEQFQNDLIGGRLEEDVLEQKGKLKRLVTKDVSKVLKIHK